MPVSQYPNLSGVGFVLQDSGLNMTPVVQPTESVLLIGTAADGPVFTPVPVDAASTAEAIFGTVVDNNGRHNGASLLLGYYEALAAGCRDIRLMRINGQYASLTLTDGGTPAVPQVMVKGRYPGSSYTSVYVEVTASSLKIWNRATPTSSAPTKTYSLSGLTYADLLNVFNADTSVHDARMELASGIDPSDPVSLAVLAPTPLAGTNLDELNLPLGNSYSDDPATNRTLRALLGRAYQALEGYPVDFVVPLDVYVRQNGGTLDFTDAQALAEHLGSKAAMNVESFGVIAVQPLSVADGTAVNALASAIDASSPNFVVGNDDLGKYLSIVVGEGLMSHTRLGVYANTLAATYAGLAASLPPHYSPMNKVLPNVSALRYQFNLNQINNIVSKGMVAFQIKPGRGVIAANDPTAAARSSDYAFLTTPRIVVDLVRAIRSVGENYVGMPLTAERRNALTSDIRSVIDSRKLMGTILNASFNLSGSIQDYIRGTVSIDLVIVPVVTLRRLVVRVSLRNEGGQA